MQYAKKSLGQNFLIDLNVLNKIVNIINIRNKNVVEIVQEKALLQKLFYQRDQNLNFN